MAERICYVTKLDKIPNNCVECEMLGCTLPIKLTRGAEVVKKAYINKRHKNCPLKVLEVTEEKE